MQDRTELGGDRLRLTCPHCGYVLTVIDPVILDYGPVRCGACGTPVAASRLQRILAESVATVPRARPLDRAKGEPSE